MVFQIILVVELLSTSWTEVFVAHPLLVNISEVSHQIISQKKLLLTDAAGNVKILLSASVSLLHVVVELHSTCETERLLVKVTNNFSALYFRSRTFVTLHRLCVFKNLHADLAVRKLLIRMP